jgi:hypothetical protein
MIRIKNDGLNMEKKIFEELNLFERRHLKIEALLFMGKWFETWRKLCTDWIYENNGNEQEELKTIPTAEGMQVGFFTALSLSDNELNDEINKRKIELEKEDKKGKDKNLKQPPEANSPEYIINIGYSPGNGDEITKMKNEMTTWKKIIDNDVEYQEGLSTIPRITSEHYKALRRIHIKGIMSLSDLNNELESLFTPSTLNFLRRNREVDKMWLDAICEYITYKYQKHIMECLGTKPMKSVNLRKGG